MGQDPSTSMTPIAHLGEFGLIDHITKDFGSYGTSVLKGIGDDASIIQTGNNQVEVISTDMLLEGVHFDLAYMPLRHLGYKAVIVNLSDIVAMNATPYGITVSVGLSSRFPVEAVEELYAGIKLACEKYHINLLGGDTTSSKQGLIISVTALGRASKNSIVYRNGAKPNDLICVSGDIGAAYAGFLILDREKSVFIDKPQEQPDLTDYDYVVGRQLKPEAKLGLIQRLNNLGVLPSAMIDISDGIASELHHICKQSKCGAKIFASKLPIDFQTVAVAEEFEISPTTFAMNGGEDYELLFSVPVADFDKIKAERDISIIGHISPDKDIIQIILESGQAADIEAQGWQHFK